MADKDSIRIERTTNERGEAVFSATVALPDWVKTDRDAEEFRALVEAELRKQMDEQARRIFHDVYGL